MARIRIWLEEELPTQDPDLPTEMKILNDFELTVDVQTGMKIMPVLIDSAYNLAD